ncbi:LCP family protein [Streptomyces sp. NPDC057910]|uniref:LCP family protein n=1 Tax=Streptomyces sp. NPDC057910 TaxID=3346278 RepID=UPI0036E2071F
MADSGISGKTDGHQSGDGCRANHRRARPDTRRGFAKATGCALVIGALLGCAGLGYAYLSLNNNIRGVDVDTALAKDPRPESAPDHSMNILVLGSDSREGQNDEYGKNEGGARSDTAMIVHVAADRQHASVVSVPRDTLVTRPNCTAENGSPVPGGPRKMFNTAFEVGGPACAVKTVESMSGLRMDHFIEVDFTGFKQLVDALGGVSITTSEAIHDPDSHLDLPVGKHTLDGEQALGLVRTRHQAPGGNGGDLARIQLQQIFLKALMKKTKNIGILSEPLLLYRVADTATKAIRTDSDLNSVDKLLGLTKTLGGVDPTGMQMITLPVQVDQIDKNRLVPQLQQDQEVWDALRNDLPVPPSATKDSAGDKATTGKYVQ